MKKSKKRTSEQVVALAVSHLFVLQTNRRNKRKNLLSNNKIKSLPQKKKEKKQERIIERTNREKINSSRTGESKEENLQASSCVRCRHALTRERDGEGINKGRRSKRVW